jgi:heme A synthase
MAHRALAFLVAGLLVAVCVQLVRAGVSGVVRALALALPVLVLAQIALGMATIVTFKETVPVTAHLLVAALLLADCVGLLSLTAPAEVAAAVADAAEDATAPSVARTRPA